jgi:sugar-specific transcriptional regulator TrmB
MDDTILQEVGLTKNEVIIYKLLLQIGSTTVGPLAKKSEIHRSKVYDALHRLVLKGFVSYKVQANRKYFQAQDPESLVSSMKERMERVESILPELKILQSTLSERQEAQVFEGYKGLKSVFDNQINQLKEGDEILVFGARSGYESAPDTWKAYFANLNKRRIKKKIKYKIIFNDEIKNNLLVKEFQNSVLSEVRFIKQKTLAGVNIHGGNVGIIVWKEKPFAFLITSKEVSDSFREYFKVLWKTAKP